MKTLVPGFMLTAVGTFAAWVYDKIRIGNEALNLKQTNRDTSLIVEEVLEFAKDTPSAANSLYTYGASNGVKDAVITHTTDSLLYSPSPVWIWFLSGALLILLVYSIINWRKL